MHLMIYFCDRYCVNLDSQALDTQYRHSGDIKEATKHQLEGCHSAGLPTASRRSRAREARSYGCPNRCGSLCYDGLACPLAINVLEAYAAKVSVRGAGEFFFENPHLCLFEHTSSEVIYKL